MYLYSIFLGPNLYSYYVGSPLRPKYILYRYMDPLGFGLSNFEVKGWGFRLAKKRQAKWLITDGSA